MLKREDYEEPRCVLCMNEKSRVPMDRVLEKFDSYLESKELGRAKSHLLYWLEEAKVNQDEAGEIVLLGELMGFCRKNSEINEAIAFAESALSKVDKYGYSDTVTGATAVLNAGTVYRAVGECQKSAALYERAEKIYEKELDLNDDRLGGLYNNYASTLTELGEFEKALEKYNKALKIMSAAPNGKLEAAITYLNMADLYVKKLGVIESETITDELLEKAYTLLTDDSIEKNAYYEFVLDKCIPAYDQFGQFLRSNELKRRINRL